MRTRRTASAIFVVVALAAVGLASSPALHARQAGTLPDRLTDQEFWRLSQDSSEANGSFRSDNLVSNEIWLQYVIPDLLARSRQGSVYLGVGPEQNFTYIAALKPKMVFITDVRRENLHMHLMYKALFELTTNRADFFALQFNKKRPAGLTAESSAANLVNAFWDLPTSTEAEYKSNLKRIQDHLTQTHKLPLDDTDLKGVEYVYWSFYWYGPAITYNSSSGRGPGNMASYGDLVMATDGANVSRGFLANEGNFNVLKSLHEKNMLVPVVGNFAGPKALRAVGKYIRDHGATVAAMYLSNVEQYLRQDAIWGTFCANVASMPLDEKSMFIRSAQQGGGGGGGGLSNSLGSMLNETRGCAGQSESPFVR